MHFCGFLGWPLRSRITELRLADVLVFQFAYVGEVDLPKFEYGDYQVCLRRIRKSEIEGCKEMVCRCWPGPRHALRYIDPFDPPRSLLIKVAEMLSLDLYCYAALSNTEIESDIEHWLSHQGLVLCIRRPSWSDLPRYEGTIALKHKEDLSALQKHKRPRDNLRVQTHLPQKPTKNTWIEFELLDDNTDEPIASVPFSIKLPNGNTVTKSTDATGVIRIDDVPPGVCDIKKIADDRGLEVIRVE